MPALFPKFLLAGFLGTLAITVTLTQTPAQPPAVRFAVAVAEADGPEVLTRGPVHEAFAATAEQPASGEIAPKAPPEPIEELPPDQKPEGDNVQWIPGYWDWDGERTDFIWISGFWRVPPPNHVWVPGSWNQVRGGFQWTSGFWQRMVPNQAFQPDIEYLPTPPAPIELGPSIPAPEATSVYVSGSWMWRGRYVWRPGFWIAHRPNWIWVPAHFRWTPVGYVFIDGYWDYPLASRGVLFTPVYFPQNTLVAGYVYTPSYVVSERAMFGALFVRRGYSSYYFGDYYEPRYSGFGYQPWCAPALRGNVGIAIVPARGFYYDPLWNYYSTSYRQTPQWSNNVTNVYVGRYDGTVARPPRTLVQQNTAINTITNTNVTNVTNNITVVNNNVTVNNKNVSQVAMVAPLTIAAKLQPEANLQPISAQVRQVEQKHAAETRQVAVVRQKAEVEAVRGRPAPVVPQPGVAPPAPPQPVKLKLELPKAAVARSLVKDEKKQPPPAPVQPKFEPKIEVPKVNPVPPPKVDPKPPVNPVPPPKVNPIPLVNPMPPKFEPKPIVNPVPPRVDPKPIVNPAPPPKFEPKPIVNPAPPPKFEPKPIVNPAPPRVDPKPIVNPVPPKFEPKPPVAPPPVVLPRVDPRPPVAPPPVVLPRVEPKPPVVQVNPVTQKFPVGQGTAIPPKVDPKTPAAPKVDPKPPINNNQARR